MTERKRRDPRAERQARRDVVPETMPAGKAPRRDPRAERNARRDLTGTLTRRDTTVVAQAAAQPTKVIDDPDFTVLVLLDLPDGRLSPHDRDVLGAARQAADRGHGAVVAIGPRSLSELASAGVDRLVPFDETEGRYQPERLAAFVRSAIEVLQPRHVFAPDNVPGAGDVARRLAAGLGLDLASGIYAIEGDSVIGRADGGRQDIVQSMPSMVLLAPECAEPYQGDVHEARVIALSGMTYQEALEDRGLIDIDTSAVLLAEADFIVSAGHGVTDWAAFHDMAAALKATEGGSRVVCDAGLLPRDRQVGASGTLVEPRCYLAFGIAGAPQHLQGIERCERVVAVNTDLHADMVKRSDLAIIQDAQAVMPALVRRARGERS